MTDYLGTTTPTITWLTDTRLIGQNKQLNLKKGPGCKLKRSGLGWDCVPSVDQGTGIRGSQESYNYGNLFSLHQIYIVTNRVSERVTSLFIYKLHHYVYHLRIILYNFYTYVIQN